MRGTLSADRRFHTESTICNSANVTPAEVWSLSPNSGLPELGCNLSKSDISDFDWERASVKGYGLSLGLNPSPGATRRPLSMGEVKVSSHPASLHFQQRLPVSVFRPRLRQLIKKTHLARIFVGQQLCLDEILQFLGRRCRRRSRFCSSPPRPSTSFVYQADSAANTAHSRIWGLSARRSSTSSG